MATEIISRGMASAKGLKFCFTGRPCHHGHVCDRYVSSYECVECVKLPQRKARTKAYDQKHSATRKAYVKGWKERNRARVNELGCIWAKLNPEKHALQARRRRARIKGAEGSHTLAEVHFLVRKQKGECAGCRNYLYQEYEVDHIMPLSKGGSDAIKNIQILCRTCNRRKNAKDPIVWARENGRLI